MNRQHNPQDEQDELDKLLELQRQGVETAVTVDVVVGALIDTIDTRARELHAEASTADRAGNRDLAATLRDKVGALREAIANIRRDFANPQPDSPA